MGDSVNIQNLLQAGYFTTSRSRSKSPGQGELQQDQDPRPVGRPRDDYHGYDPPYDRPRRSPSPIRLPPPPSHARYASRSRPAPPRPTLDDEISILDKEPGYTKTVAPKEEAASRGDVDQAQTIMEVHEFNPERRFVILDDEAAANISSDIADSIKEETDARPKVTASSKPEIPSDDPDKHHTRARSAGLSPPPPSGRRRSRQDLPVLETEFSDRQYTEHHRSRSAVNGPRPDYFNPSRSSRFYGDQLLSPDLMKQSSRGREDGYYGAEYRDRPRERRYSRISPENSSSRRPDPASEYRAPRRTNSTDRGSDRRDREYYSASSRENTSSRPVQISSRESARSSARTSREPSRSKDEHPMTSQPPSASRMPLIVQEESPVNVTRPPDPQISIAAKPSTRSSTLPPEKIPPRTNTMPAYPADRPPVLRPAATINLAKESHNSLQSSLPYPEEDAFHIDPLSVARDVTSGNGSVPAIYMPTLPSESTAGAPLRQKTVNADGPQFNSPGPELKEWKPPSFDPERDGVKTDRPVGTYRRYSENKTDATSDRLPNCPRMKPVIGKVDWLTLPRTDFNICPDCYGQVFSNSEYRTHFQPVLRPTVDALACDFGSSPWYRIAWLLILKNNGTDLQVFHDIAAISAACRGYRCPGDRRTTRDWYTVRDPSTKRPVPEFTVCYQCAKTVEAVLPSLGGIFVPLESRSSPIRSNCALHFAPDRTDFVLYFDSFETTADKAENSRKGPDLAYLSRKLERLSVHNGCREDKPVSDEYWHIMQFLPQFTVCADCFEDVVQPRLQEENGLARNFYRKPQKISLATCQLYSPRMREAFKRACRKNDHKYLESKVMERLEIESSIKSKLAKLDRDGQRDARTDKQIDALIEDWKEWE